MDLGPGIHALLVNGAIVLVAGNLCGFAFGRAIARRRPEEEQRAWRVAHTGIAAGGVMMRAAAAALFLLAPGPLLAWAVAGPLIAGGYGFALALPLGAMLRERGLGPRPGPAATAVFLGNALGAVGSLVGSLALVGAALVT